MLDSSVQVLGTSSQYVIRNDQNRGGEIQPDKENNYWNADLKSLSISYQHQVDQIN